MCRAIRAIRDAVPDIGLLTDVALDPYTAHGHDGLVDEGGYVLNDRTAELFGRPVAQPGACGGGHHRAQRHDGRPRRPDPRGAGGRGSCQRPDHGLCCPKNASAFYGPFRDAVGSRGLLKGDKKTYQMDPANAEEALREVEMDRTRGGQRDGQAGAALSRYRPPREGGFPRCRCSPIR
ncbi:delta-aminolevulinic acid dehydratase domain-containing protein [Ditylenchus destructor]|uniref:porphobilinogen synthase n=1 Tax=Ditylenchus destructor TaxID=166010 RepID=A0AAD4MIP3_9BILA|nr:delta-aminolevulinic acid dehydratase domain-containing protein [Ditylenchus destructor]